ncbi:MAG: hypothetical protein ACYC7E_09015 [Armatimonadota bacterium]
MTVGYSRMHVSVYGLEITSGEPPWPLGPVVLRPPLTPEEQREYIGDCLYNLLVEDKPAQLMEDDSFSQTAQLLQTQSVLERQIPHGEQAHYHAVLEEMQVVVDILCYGLLVLPYDRELPQGTEFLISLYPLPTTSISPFCSTPHIDGSSTVLSTSPIWSPFVGLHLLPATRKYLEDAGVAAIVAYLAESPSTPFRDALKMGLRWLNLALRQTHVPTRVALLCASLETLFSAGNSEVKTICSRAELMMEPSTIRTHPDTNADDLKSLYALRDHYLHGGNKPLDAVHLARIGKGGVCLRLVAHAIWGLWQHHAQFGKCREKVKYLNMIDRARLMARQA